MAGTHLQVVLHCGGHLGSWGELCIFLHIPLELLSFPSLSYLQKHRVLMQNSGELRKSWEAADSPAGSLLACGPSHHI